MSQNWDDTRAAFADAAAWFARVVAVVDGRWDRPGLGEWDIRSLVGHTSRAMITVEQYLARPVEAAQLNSPVAYYRATSALSKSELVVERARVAGVGLGADPAAAVAEIAHRVVSLLAGCDGSELMTTAAGGMRLDAYLPTRVFELVVHTSDLAVALGEAVEVPDAPARVALGLAAELAIESGTAGVLLLAATGRDGLPPGFTLL